MATWKTLLAVAAMGLLAMTLVGVGVATAYQPAAPRDEPIPTAKAPDGGAKPRGKELEKPTSEKPTRPSPEVLKKIEARLIAAKEVVEFNEKRVEAIGFPGLEIEEWNTWSRRLADAEAEYSGDSNKRVQAYEAHLARILNRSKSLKKALESGQISKIEISKAKYYATEAEMLVEQEKLKK